MRNIIFALLAIFTFAQCSPKTSTTLSDKDYDAPEIAADASSTNPSDFRSKAPKAGPAPEIQIGTYEAFDLANGLKVILVENHKTPIVSFQLTLDNDPVMEKEFAGYSDMAGDMLTKGTKNRTKAQMDEEIDFIGGSLNSSGSGMFASSLTKHSDKLLGLMSDALLNPIFPQKEFEKMKKRTISGIQSAKDDPNTIAGQVGAVLRNGSSHPYGEIATEKTVESITLDKCKSYYNTYFKPNAAYLVIVGDMTLADAKTAANKFFGAWEKGDVPSHSYKKPTYPSETQVAFVDKPGAVQTVISVTYPVDITPGHPDAIKASLTNAILGGGGFSGRLMQNLREDKAFTYGARSSLRTDPLAGRFAAGASVRNEVTDSSVVEFLYEMNRMRNKKVAAEDLQKTKNIMTGSFARSLERPQTIARFALNTARYNLPKDYYANYLKNLNAVTITDVQAMARKYIRPSNAYVVVVGNKEEVADKLSGFAKSGKVDFYDNYGQPIKEATTEIAADLDAYKIVEKYVEAIGGKAKLKGVKDYIITMGVNAQGQDVLITQMGKLPNKYYMKAELPAMGIVAQEMIFDGTKGKMKGMQGNSDMDEKTIAGVKERINPFPEATYKEDGYKLELKGVENLYGKDAYKIEVISPSGKKSTEYYDVASGLKMRSMEKVEGPMGEQVSTTEYEDYRDVDGIKMPFVMSSKQGVLKMKEVEFNTNMSDDKFKVD